MSLYDTTLLKVSLAPAAVTAAANGSAVDTAVNGGMQDAMLVVVTGTVTDGTYTVAVEDSADGSTGWTAVDASSIQGALPAIPTDGDDTVYEVGVRNTRRYLRAAVAEDSASSGAIIGCYFALNSPRYSPVTRS